MNWFYYLNPIILDKTPFPATMDRIKKRYPLNPAQKEIIKHYEKLTPGELAHNQTLSTSNHSGKI
jgi:hypothetical protein